MYERVRVRWQWGLPGAVLNEPSTGGMCAWTGTRVQGWGLESSRVAEPWERGWKDGWAQTMKVNIRSRTISNGVWSLGWPLGRHHSFALGTHLP